jgi:hypothetical protein
VAYDVSSLAQGQYANLTNGNTSDYQTIDSIASNNNNEQLELPFQNNDHSNPNNTNNPKVFNSSDNQGQK